MNLDAININILQALQKDAKLTNTAIGKMVGISSPAVTERIRKMEDEGVIEAYKTIISPLSVGYQFKAIITIKAFMGKLKPFIEKVKTYDEVTNCYRVTGNENIVMEVVLRDQKHLEKLIDELITYGETKTQIVLSQIIHLKPIKPLNFR